MFLYKPEVITESSKNVLFQVFGCIYAGVKHKLKNIRNHTWIDGTKDQYTMEFIDDVCTILKASPVEKVHFLLFIIFIYSNRLKIF